MLFTRRPDLRARPDGDGRRHGPARGRAAPGELSQCPTSLGLTIYPSDVRAACRRTHCGYPGNDGVPPR
jgi:hypothetical protein